MPASRPAEGLRVVEWAEGIAGPYAGLILSSLGASVVKVERPTGDWARYTGADRSHATFIALNGNKRSLAVNAKSAAGHEVMIRLINRADVVIVSYHADTLRRLKFGQRVLSGPAPGRIVARVRGFGGDRRAHEDQASDTIIQAVSGMMSLVGESDGPPMRIGFPLIDLVAGRDLALKIVASMLARARGRRGATSVEVSLFGTATSLLALSWESLFVGASLPRRSGHSNNSLAPGGVYACRDGGLVALAVLHEDHWSRLKAALREPGLEQVEFETSAARRRNRAALRKLLDQACKRQTRAELLAALSRTGVLVAPVNSLRDVAQSTELDRLIEHRQVRYGDREFDSIENPFESVGAPRGSRRSAALVVPERPGADSLRVLRSLGYTKSECAALFASGSVS